MCLVYDLLNYLTKYMHMHIICCQEGTDLLDIILFACPRFWGLSEVSPLL